MDLESELLNKKAKPDFLMLAHVYKNQNVAGWYCSTKLDGMRAFWDGGITIGKPVNTIPWADVGNDTRPSTGLWSRLRKPIIAPDWWTAGLPRMPLDGELWIENNTFQQLMSICRRHVPTEGWRKVKFMVIDSPYPGSVGLPLDGWDYTVRRRNYEETIDLLNAKVPGRVVQQNKLPLSGTKEFLEHMLNIVVTDGGEGLMLRNPTEMWQPKRSSFLLKYKPFNDSEAKVLGYIWGEGKYEGMLGALIVKWRDITFELSGMTDAERKMTPFKENAPIGAPRTPVNEWFNEAFPISSTVTFRYRSLTDGGTPKEARYKRKELPDKEIIAEVLK